MVELMSMTTMYRFQNCSGMNKVCTCVHSCFRKCVVVIVVYSV